MKCSQCHIDNPGNAKFCIECGNPMDLRCPACGSVTPAQGKFCMECGEKLSPASTSVPRELSFDEKISSIQRFLPSGLTEKILSQRGKIEGERKHATVMFCDLVGFTSLVEDLGEEKAYGIMDRFYEVLIHEVHRYEGTVNEMTGDGVMALFGVPRAIENSSQRAIQSALSIHREITKFSNQEKGKALVSPLEIRIGVHTGPVVVGALGNDLRVEFKAVGNTVNIAKRMEETADPGATYVTEDTFRLCRGLFRFEGLGERQLKGKTDSVRIYRVIGPSSQTSRFEVNAEEGLTPFVGRERELELLLDGFERVKAGSGQAFSIVAEAGVGKTRLLHEFSKAVANEDVVFRQARCLSYSRGEAYQPIIELLKTSFQIHESDDDAEIRRKVAGGLQNIGMDHVASLPYLLQVLSVRDSGVDDALSNEENRYRFMETLKNTALKDSEAKPVIIAFEDMHWVDNGSEDAIRGLFENIAGSRVMLIFTYRPEYLHTWGAKTFHSQINLNRLSNRESLLMISHILGDADIDSSLAELALEKTEGVPFFIEELIKSLVSLKVIENRNGRYDLAKEKKGLAIPSTIHDVIMARIDPLPDAAKRTLQIGSVIGREFGFEILKQITQLPDQELLAHLSELKDRELLYERGIWPQSVFSFKHAYTHDVAYDSILEARRAEIHGKTGQAIEALFPGRLEEHYKTLAHHYSESKNPEKAYEYSKKAAEKAIHNYSNREGYALCKEAIKALRQMSDTGSYRQRFIEIVELMIDAAWPLSYPEGTLEILKEGEGFAQSTGDEKALVRIQSVIGDCHNINGDLPLAIEYGEKAYAKAEELANTDLIIEASEILMNIYTFNGWMHKANEIGIKAIHLITNAQREDDFFGMGFNAYAYFCSIVGTQMCYLGNFDEGYAYSRRGSAHAAETSDILTLAMAEVCHGFCCSLRGEGEAAKRHLQKSLRHFEKREYPIGLGAAHAHLGWAHYLLGELEAAREHVEKSCEIQAEKGSLSLAQMCSYYLSMLYYEFGDLEKGRDYTEKALATAQSLDSRHSQALISISLGRILAKADLGLVDEAENAIRGGIAVLEELDLRPHLAQGYLFLGILYKETNREEMAIENLKMAEESFAEMGMPYWLEKAQAALAGC